ncbi:HNH endonuclease [Streptomyces sp. NBC_00554]|uniref:HNH endonuclease n=1 Tax=Streptomyces sp. NBC_00554 TaxID=2903661 RepID=UPI00352EDAE2|nr:HNH endonuclease [Streptomyces sp. NBC_00554]
MTPALRLVYGCPKWCTEDHTIQQGEDRECHSGEGLELSLPDGTLMMEARLVHEAGEKFPQLAVFGPGLDALKVDDVTLLGADEAAALEADVQRFLHRIQKAARFLQGNRPKRPKKNKRALPPSLQHAPRETRLYLAERDGRRCFYCRTPFDGMREATADHYIPRSAWECNLPANLVLSCEPCNTAKADQLTWSMAAVLLAWAGREASEAGETPSWGRAEAAC